MPEGNGWLIAEFGGDTREEADAKAHALMDDLKKLPNPPSMKLYDDPDEEKKIWEVREAGLGATARVPDEHRPGKAGKTARCRRKKLVSICARCENY